VGPTSVGARVGPVIDTVSTVVVPVKVISNSWRAVTVPSAGEIVGLVVVEVEVSCAEIVVALKLKPTGVRAIATIANLSKEECRNLTIMRDLISY
jgi:hypothetical protein